MTHVANASSWVRIIMLHLGLVGIAVFLGANSANGPNDLLIAPSIATFLAQMSLVGTWAGVASVSMPCRILGFVCGTLYSASFCALVFDEFGAEILIMIVTGTGLVTIVLLLARRDRFDLVSVYEISSHDRDGLQFQVKHLFALTFFVAIAVKVGNGLVPWFHSGGVVADSILYGIYTSLNAVLCIWACLGVFTPRWRCGIVLLLSLGFGSALAIRSNDDLLGWTVITMGVTFIQMLTLLLVRASGYRITRRLAGY